jgi:hypothetical protein
LHERSLWHLARRVRVLCFSVWSDGWTEFETKPCRRAVGLSDRRMVEPNLRLNPVGGLPWAAASSRLALDAWTPAPIDRPLHHVGNLWVSFGIMCAHRCRIDNQYSNTLAILTTRPFRPTPNHGRRAIRDFPSSVLVSRNEIFQWSLLLHIFLLGLRMVVHCRVWQG